MTDKLKLLFPKPAAPHWPAILEVCRAADTTWWTAFQAYALITGEELPRFAVGSLVNGRDMDMRISEATADDIQDAEYPARVRRLAQESVERLLKGDPRWRGELEPKGGPR